MALWLGISPPDLFFYAVSRGRLAGWHVTTLNRLHSKGEACPTLSRSLRSAAIPLCHPQFIPPLALDSALHLDMFLFRKVLWCFQKGEKAGGQGCLPRRCWRPLAGAFCGAC